MCHAYIWTHPKLSSLKQVIALNFASDRVINSWLSFLSLSIPLKLYWTVSAALASLIVSCFPNQASNYWRSKRRILVPEHKINEIVISFSSTALLTFSKCLTNSCQSAYFKLSKKATIKRVGLTVLQKEEIKAQRAEVTWPRVHQDG